MAVAVGCGVSVGIGVAVPVGRLVVVGWAVACGVQPVMMNKPARKTWIYLRLRMNAKLRIKESLL
jgi:hypothetical protein